MHAIRRQAQGGDVAEQARAYSSALKGDAPRQRFVQQLPDGDEPTWGAAQNERWSLIRATARAALEDRIANPCKGAWHFGGPKLAPDVRRAAKAVSEGRWRPVRCKPGVKNKFFALKKRGTLSAAEAAGAKQK